MCQAYEATQAGPYVRLDQLYPIWHGSLEGFDTLSPTMALTVVEPAFVAVDGSNSTSYHPPTPLVDRWPQGK